MNKKILSLPVSVNILALLAIIAITIVGFFSLWWKSLAINSWQSFDLLLFWTFLVAPLIFGGFLLLPLGGRKIKVAFYIFLLAALGQAITSMLIGKMAAEIILLLCAFILMVIVVYLAGLYLKTTFLPQQSPHSREYIYMALFWFIIGSGFNLYLVLNKIFNFQIILSNSMFHFIQIGIYGFIFPMLLIITSQDQNLPAKIKSSLFYGLNLGLVLTCLSSLGDIVIFAGNCILILTMVAYIWFLHLWREKEAYWLFLILAVACNLAIIILPFFNKEIDLLWMAGSLFLLWGFGAGAISSLLPAQKILLREKIVPYVWELATLVFIGSFWWQPLSIAVGIILIIGLFLNLISLRQPQSGEIEV